MNKAELAKVVAVLTETTAAQAGRNIDAVFLAITTAMASGESVAITSFGLFEVRDRAARLAHNPATGGKVEVAAKKAPAFKPYPSLKDVVNGDKPLPESAPDLDAEPMEDDEADTVEAAPDAAKEKKASRKKAVEGSGKAAKQEPSLEQAMLDAEAGAGKKKQKKDKGAKKDKKQKKA